MLFYSQESRTPNFPITGRYRVENGEVKIGEEYEICNRGMRRQAI